MTSPTLQERLRDPGKYETRLSELLKEAADALDAKDTKIGELQDALRLAIAWLDEDKTLPGSYADTEPFRSALDMSGDVNAFIRKREGLDQ